MRSGRFKSRVRIYRPTSSRNARGATIVEHQLVGTAWIDISTLRRALQNFGAGEMPQGSMEIDAYAAADIRSRDVIEVFAGPEVGSTWRVEGVTRPGNSSLLGVLTPYNEPLEIVA